ncbi:MAG: peptidylprolyl isomerase [Phycisphaerales bacterium]
MRSPTALLVVLLASALAAPGALGQAPPPTSAPPASPSAPPRTQTPREAMRSEYEQLSALLARKPTLTADDRATIQSLLTRIQAAIAAGSADPMNYAMCARLAGWIDDAAAEDKAYEGLLAVQPNNEVAASQWIAAITKRGRYEQALGVARNRYRDLTQMPRVAMAIAETLIAANRYEEAVELLDSIGNIAGARADLGAKFVPLRQRAATLGAMWSAEQAKRIADEKEGQNAHVELITSKGTILIELYEREAPAAAFSFVELVDTGAYNGTRFHRRLPGFAVIGGDANTKPGATGRPGYGTVGWRIPDEGMRSDRRPAFGGTIGLCKALDPKSPTAAYLPKSAGSQFFFLLQPAEHLNEEIANFTIFGRILDGWDTVVNLEPGDELLAAQVVRRGSHEYKAVRDPDLPMPVEMSVPAQAVKPKPTQPPNQAATPASGKPTKPAVIRGTVPPPVVPGPPPTTPPKP